MEISFDELPLLINDALRHVDFHCQVIAAADSTGILQ